MKNLLKKELSLAASPLSFWFLAAVLLTFVPGYPILLGGFFVTLGMFYSFQSARENNDIAYSLLLPVSKADIVRGKYLFCLFLEGIAFLAAALFTLARMLFFADAEVYLQNTLMPANLAFLGFLLVLFGLFNAIFLCGFLKTGYYFGKPFLFYCVVSLFVIGIAETLKHLPGLGALGALGFEPILPQAGVLLGGAILFTLLTFFSCRAAIAAFEKADL